MTGVTRSQLEALIAADRCALVDFHPLRKPCSSCGAFNGRIDRRRGQDCVFCLSCGRWQYNAPRTETGSGRS